MRLLHRSSGLDLVLGVGLVGEQVAEAARRLPGSPLLGDETIPTDWDDLSLDVAASRIAALAPPRVRLFWCAGKAGFGADVAQCDAELRRFEAVLRWAERVDVPLEFHLTSSAGGLHEGQLLVSSHHDLNTARPYAKLKWAQEQALAASKLTARFVYRLSSVYGLPAPSRRLGLISTLVLNALRHRPTLITAHASTQRDFVSAADVGRFMALEEKPNGAWGDTGLHYLVSGTPLSIWALQLAVERALLRPVAVVYSVRKDNVASTSFLPSLRPPHWDASPVESNLPRIAQAAQCFGERANQRLLK